MNKSPKGRRKVEKVDVISRSPRYANNIPSPHHHNNENSRSHSRSFIENGRENQNLSNNNSLIANHKNTIYLDSDSSRLVNPL